MAKSVVGGHQLSLFSPDKNTSLREKTSLRIPSPEKTLDHSWGLQFSATQLSDALCRVIENELQIEQVDDNLYRADPIGTLPAKAYREYKELVTRLRGTWERKRKQHLFEFDPTDLFQLVRTHKILPDKNPLSYFSSPLSVIEELMLGAGLATLDDGIYRLRFQDDRLFKQDRSQWSILDPSAGTGVILDAVKQGFPEAKLYAVELDPFRRAVLESKGYTLLGDDFLTLETDLRFDYILMNPPFSSKGNKLLSIDHIEKAFTLLAQYGKLASVVPEGLFFSRTAKCDAFLNKVNAQGESWKLPEGSFAESGTGVSTRIISLENRLDEDGYKPYYGYPSRWCYHVMLILDNDSDFHNETIGQLVEKPIEDKPTLRRFLRSRIQEVLYSQRRENGGVFCDEQTLESCIAKCEETISEYREEIAN